MTEIYEPDDLTRVRRDDRSDYRVSTIHEVFDEATFCHVAFVDDGRPVAIPMLHARVGEELLLHGSHATRLFRIMGTSPMISVTATILDGLVLARSAFHHSANYRSAIVFGTPRRVDSIEERRAALDALTDRLVPGRRQHLRPMTEKEVRGTAMIGLPIDRASAKVRVGGPVDEEEDRNWPVWAGVLPVMTTIGDPIPDQDTPLGSPLPDHIIEMLR